ncbi:MAG: hypothetical protein IPJ82_05790 [Lewinellaceae bacterium]|nr:hypothetical protein [Lewinellaceae bacterium]
MRTCLDTANSMKVRLEWDAANMRITNFEDANAFVGREYRDGWGLGM